MDIDDDGWTHVRACLTRETQELLRVTVHKNTRLYSKGDPGESWTFPVRDDGVTYLLDAQPERPFIDADRILAENGWTREGRWVVGDVVTGTYATISRTEPSA